MISDRTYFGTLPDGRSIDSYRLTNANGLRMQVIAYGGIIVSLETPDRTGAFADIVLGYDTLDAYLADTTYFGALIGRYANRIAGARFALDGDEYTFTPNDGPNLLHGGPQGFHAIVWDMEPLATGDGIVLSHTSADGDGGFPGTLTTRVTYTLSNDNVFAITYDASTDRATHVNPTQHVYLNLGGHDSGPITGHELQLAASSYTPVDEHLIPTGAIQPVIDTPFDFATPSRIGARIDDDDAQLRIGGGYDHNYVIDRLHDRLTLAARVREPVSGRTMDVWTTEPGIQLYTGNAMPNGIPAKLGTVYNRRGGLCLETQHFPDSPNQPSFPSTVLRPDDVFQSRTEYRFGAD